MIATSGPVAINNKSTTKYATMLHQVKTVCLYNSIAFCKPRSLHDCCWQSNESYILFNKN